MQVWGHMSGVLQVTTGLSMLHHFPDHLLASLIHHITKPSIDIQALPTGQCMAIYTGQLHTVKQWPINIIYKHSLTRGQVFWPWPLSI